MLVLRVLLVGLTAVMIAMALVVEVLVLLGVGWLAVAVPVLAVIGLVAAVVAVWRRIQGGSTPSA